MVVKERFEGREDVTMTCLGKFPHFFLLSLATLLWQFFVVFLDCYRFIMAI